MFTHLNDEPPNAIVLDAYKQLSPKLIHLEFYPAFIMVYEYLKKQYSMDALKDVQDSDFLKSNLIVRRQEDGFITVHLWGWKDGRAGITGTKWIMKDGTSPSTSFADWTYTMTGHKRSDWIYLGEAVHCDEYIKLNSLSLKHQKDGLQS